ncbi:MAG: polyhydroxyalkanoate synthesis repressor PhaR [Candidatus Parabeggiatoa sp. nov. 1]|nr:MAG: polyhydroxyalkanoate synthesis repressor PhaR [Gammaproteobacteria bacterium]
MNTNEPRIIKKYPNRRLYDTAISRYITLKEVKNLVKQHVTFQIQDAKTGEDITRSILLQIILEQEEKGEPIFTSEMLAQLIRFYGDTLQGIVANYFEKSLVLFAKQQDELRKNMYNPVSFMTDIAEQNLKLWKDLQDNVFKTAWHGSSHKHTKNENQPENSDD